MALKNTRLALAENLSKELREKFDLPDSGLVIIESRNPDLSETIIAIGSEGIRGYLLTLGNFEDIEIADE